MVDRQVTDWSSYLDQIKQKDFFRSVGQVTKVSNLIVEASGIKGLIGDLCSIESRSGTVNCKAEIVGLRDKSTLLMPYGDTRGISLDSKVLALGYPTSIKVGSGLLGRVINPFGEPLDDKPLDVSDSISLRGICHNPLHREAISDLFETGVRVIDVFLPLGKGQRVGIFAGSGVGKTTLLNMIARKSKADINVIALIGERGREVKDFLDKVLDKDTLSRSVIIVATSDQPALVRELAAHTATAVAEYFCARNKDVLLIMDSATRFAMAHREIGLSVGEPATARGYTPSAFGALPKLLERAGNFAGKGSITAIYTVLVEGDDLHEPVSDNMRAILDGHIVLSRELANHGHYPAIDLLASISRLATDLWLKEERELVKKIIRLLSVRMRHKDMIEIGAYKSGSNHELDVAIAIYEKLEPYLTQTEDDESSRIALFEYLSKLMSEHAH